MEPKQFKIHDLDTLVSVTGLVNASYYKLPKDFSWTGEVHDFWEMVYVDQGEMIITAGTNNYLLKAGELAFHCPNEFHNLQTNGKKTANVIVIAFTSTSPMMKAFERKILSVGSTARACLSSIVREAEQTYAHFENIASHIDLRQRESSPYGSQQAIKNLLEYFLILIHRQEDSITIDDRMVSIHQLHHHAKLAMQVKEYINEHYSEKITLETLALKHNISLSQLKRIFKEQLGVSVITYLTNYRIGEAKRMIQEETMNFSQIAVAVGYDNIYYFSTLFKKQTGMTLTEFSKSVRQ